MRMHSLSLSLSVFLSLSIYIYIYISLSFRLISLPLSLSLFLFTSYLFSLSPWMVISKRKSSTRSAKRRAAAGDAHTPPPPTTPTPHVFLKDICLDLDLELIFLVRTTQSDGKHAHTVTSDSTTFSLERRTRSPY